MDKLSNIFKSKNYLNNNNNSFDIDRFINSIGVLETGGVKTDPYKFVRHSGDSSLGNALGKYQVTEGEFKKNAGRYLPKETSIEQFINNPSLQDQYMRKQALYRSSLGFTPQQIADFHRKGAGVLESEKSEYHQPGSAFFLAPDYVSEFTKLYNKK
jgi:hypothetical protein